MNEPRKHRVAIVTDSTADLPADLVAHYDIHVVPQILIMGDKTWQDGVDIDSATFYELLRTSTSFPSTSQPSVASFHALFNELADRGEGIVAVLVSAELSGTVNSARAAAASLPEIPIEIVDARTTSMQLGLIVLAVARAAAQGHDLRAVADTARALVGRVRVYFVVDTLEYLHRGGRIGAAARLFGSALNLKPVLQICDGIVQPVAKIRSRRKALERVCQLVEEEASDGQQLHMAVLHVAAPQEAAHLQDYLREQFQPAELYLCECGPVIGTHAGPGTVGVAYYVGE
jgi:DegV family protein with EDD domain